jgi:hypothetical protein
MTPKLSPAEREVLRRMLKQRARLRASGHRWDWTTELLETISGPGVHPVTVARLQRKRLLTLTTDGRSVLASLTAAGEAAVTP